MSPVRAAFSDEIVRTEALFKRIKAVYDTRTRSGLTAEQQRLTEVQYMGFVWQGAALDEIVQTEALFKRIKAVYDTRTRSGLTAEQQRLTEVQYMGFVWQGAALDK